MPVDEQTNVLSDIIHTNATPLESIDTLPTATTVIENQTNATPFESVDDLASSSEVAKNSQKTLVHDQDNLIGVSESTMQSNQYDRRTSPNESNQCQNVLGACSSHPLITKWVSEITASNEKDGCSVEKSPRKRPGQSLPALISPKIKALRIPKISKEHVENMERNFSGYV